jgi:hypothetical protein
MKLFAKLLFALCLLAALSFDLDAQVGEVGGPIIDIEFIAVCDDGTTVFNMVQTIVGGSSNPTSLGYVTATGAAHTLSGGTLTGGFCDGGTGTAAIDYTTTVQALCDDGTPFYRVAVFSGDTITATATADFELDLSTTYTPAGTVFSGPCAVTTTAAISRIVTATTGSISAGAFSFEICNEGTANGTVTVGGGSAATLIPGSCTSYRSTYNPSTRQYKVAPAVSYVATGTSFAVVVEN